MNKKLILQRALLVYIERKLVQSIYTGMYKYIFTQARFIHDYLIITKTIIIELIDERPENKPTTCKSSITLKIETD